MFTNVINGITIQSGCIHNLESECVVVNKELGSCTLQCDIEPWKGWSCPFFRCNVLNVKDKVKQKG